MNKNEKQILKYATKIMDAFTNFAAVIDKEQFLELKALTEEPKWREVTKEEMENCVKPDCAQFLCGAEWESANGDSWNNYTYRIPADFKLESIWTTPTDEDIVRCGRLECEFRDYNSLWAKGLLWGVTDKTDYVIDGILRTNCRVRKELVR